MSHGFRVKTAFVPRVVVDGCPIDCGLERVYLQVFGRVHSEIPAAAARFLLDVRRFSCGSNTSPKHALCPRIRYLFNALGLDLPRVLTMVAKTLSPSSAPNLSGLRVRPSSLSPIPRRRMGRVDSPGSCLEPAHVRSEAGGLSQCGTTEILVAEGSSFLRKGRYTPPERIKRKP